MPVWSGGTGVVPEPIPTDPTIPPIPEPPPEIVPDVLAERYAEWHAPDGTIVPLSTRSAGFWLMRGVAGVGVAPTTLATRGSSVSGVDVDGVRTENSLITLPIRMSASSMTGLRDTRRYLSDKFAQTGELGPGRLRILWADGDWREIYAYYADGLGAADGGRAEVPVVTLLCERGVWLGPEKSVPFEYSGSTADFYDPLFSLRPANTLGDAVIFNEGDLPAYPSVLITGPTSLAQADNVTTGEGFTVDPDWDGHGDLLLGESVTVTTDPARVRGPLDEIWTGAINFPAGKLWTLAKGRNALELSFAGAAAGTSITVSYRPRYRTY